MVNNDLPKYWNEETGEIIEAEPMDLVPVQEEITPLPTISEQKSIVTSAEDISDTNKSILGSLIELNSVGEVLKQLRYTETAEQRKLVLDGYCESFVNARIHNNIVAEQLKAKLLERLLNNLENLDLETTSRIYNDLHDVTSVDAQQAFANINGGGVPMPGQNNGTTVNLNLATAEGAMITNNTLNANPQQVGQLKEVSTLNSSIKAWSNIPLPKQNG